MDYYKQLGVKFTASKEEIKTAYVSLMKKYHPDLYKGDKSFAEKKTAEINNAYNVLKDDNLKREYDSTYTYRNVGKPIEHSNKDNLNNEAGLFKQFKNRVKKYFNQNKNDEKNVHEDNKTKNINNEKINKELKNRNKNKELKSEKLNNKIEKSKNKIEKTNININKKIKSKKIINKKRNEIIINEEYDKEYNKNEQIGVNLEEFDGEERSKDYDYIINMAEKKERKNYIIMMSTVILLIFLFLLLITIF